MKGKGKGDRGGDKSEKNEMKDPSLEFIDLSVLDHVKQCPRYTAVVNRNKEDGIVIEEIDSLQMELETLLSSAAKRMQQLTSEIDILNGAENKSTPSKSDVKGKDIRGKLNNSSTSDSSPSKRGAGKGNDEKPSKKQKLDEAPSTPGKRTSSKTEKPESAKKSKETPGKGSSSGKATPSRGPKGKNIASAPTTAEAVVPPATAEALTPPPPPPKPDAPVRAAKNDVLNRFWAMVEPYCAEITTDDLKVLEDIMKSHEDDADFYKIPPLGKHYAEKWAHEDMLEEQRQSNKLNDKRRNSSTGSTGSTEEAASMLKKAKEGAGDGESPYGPLTQRLVQALIEENIMTPIDDACISEADAAEAASISPRSLAKQLNMGNAASLERKIKRELELEGIIDGEEKDGDDDPNDEVLAELKRKQAELKAISQHNMSITKRLYKMAKEEMTKQDLRKRIIVADAEVMDAYRKIQQSRLKKKTYTKKEIDSVKRALKEREALIKQLDSGR